MLCATAGVSILCCILVQRATTHMHARKLPTSLYCSCVHWIAAQWGLTHMLLTAMNHRETNVVLQLACGGEHTMAITQQGRVFSWGRGSTGQTGLGTTDTVTLPTRLQALQDHHVTQVCRPCNTCKHAVSGLFGSSACHRQVCSATLHI